MSENIVVTGGAGFIGSHLAKLHLDRGDSVRVIDNLQTGSLNNIESFKDHPGFTFKKGDVRKVEDIIDAVKWADRIYHMAANVGQKYVLAYPVETLRNNIAGAETVLEAIKETKSPARLLMASTSEVYCHSDIKPDEKVKEELVSCYPSGQYLQESYPLAKFVNEVMGLAYIHQYDIECTIARLFNTIGPHQSPDYGFVVPNFMIQALKGDPITVFGDGLQTRSFSSVHDTVKALALLLDTKESRGQIVNVGDDRESSVLDLAKLIKRLTNSESEIKFMGYQEAYGVDFVDVRRRCPDLSKLKKLTGFVPSIGLEKTIQEIIPEVKRAL